MGTSKQYPNPSEIAAIGEKIYQDQYRSAYEREHFGKYVAINIRDGSAVLGDTPEAAMNSSRTRAGDGLFHLIRIGYPSVYTSSSQTPYGNKDWLFG